MKHSLIDALARHLGPTTRRGAVRLLGGTWLAGAAGLLGAGAADAGKKRCGRGKKRCGKRCIAKQKCCGNASCLPGQVCQKRGACAPRSRGRLTANDALWIPCEAAFGPRHFETYTLDWPGGPISVLMQSAVFRAWVWLYEANRFDPRTPCSIGAFDAQAAAPGAVARIDVLLPQGTYAVVATSAADAANPGPATGRFGIVFEASV